MGEGAAGGGAASASCLPFLGRIHMVFPESHTASSNTSSAFLGQLGTPAPCNWPKQDSRPLPHRQLRGEPAESPRCTSVFGDLGGGV